MIRHIDASWLRRIVAAAAVPAVLATAGPATAETTKDTYVAPPIGGHVTDPDHELDEKGKETIEHLFSGIQDHSKVDVAAFIAPVPGDQVEAAGHAAYAQWGIGRDWDAGVLLVLTRDGQGCRIITDKRPSQLSDVQIAQIETTALQLAKSGHFERALRSAGETFTALLGRDQFPTVRPPGEHAWRLSLAYGFGALLIVAGSTVRTIRRRRTWLPA